MEICQTRKQLRWVFALQAFLLAVAAWRNAHQINPDAVAYCRIAGYYGAGQWELAVTGYWGPLLSWLMVPPLKLGCGPLTAARVVMAASGIVFLCGTVAAFRAFRLPSKAMLAGAWITAGWSVFWSVRNISPDLLMAGLAGLAMAATMKAMLAPRRPFTAAIDRPHSSEDAATESHRQGRVARLGVAAGAWWALAYLTKAVALPWAVLVTAGFALFATSGRPELRRELAARLGVVWLCLGLVAGPWIAALSLHYGKFTFSTTGPIAHALAGPGEEWRYHPAMVTLHQPDAGRVTQWEEPSRMAYRYWRPFESAETLRHQLAVVGANLAVELRWLAPWIDWFEDGRIPGWRRWLGAFDLLGLGAVAVVFVAGWWLPGWPYAGPWLWRAALLPLVLLAGLYLPFFVMREDNRYFYPVWPVLWVLTVAARLRPPPWRRVGWLVIIASFAVPAGLWCAAALRGLPNPAAEAAHDLAVRVRSDKHSGPIAGSAFLPGGRAGLYAAFLLNERWLGDDAQASAEEFESAGARVIVLRRDSSQREVFNRAAGWRAMEPAGSRPLIVFVRETR